MTAAGPPLRILAVSELCQGAKFYAFIRAFRRMRRTDLGSMPEITRGR